MKICEQSLNCNRPVQFLRIVKKHLLFNQNGNADDVIKLLDKFQINQNLEKLREKLMAPPILEIGHILKIINKKKSSLVVTFLLQPEINLGSVLKDNLCVQTKKTIHVP